MTAKNEEQLAKVGLMAPRDLVDKVARIAVAEDRSVSSVVRAALREYVANKEASGEAA